MSKESPLTGAFYCLALDRVRLCATVSEHTHTKEGGMMSKENGGAAFPAGIVRKSRPPHDPGADFHVTDYTEPRNPGISARDYFAAKAMQGMQSGDYQFMADIARDAYLMADAMLAERAK